MQASYVKPNMFIHVYICLLARGLVLPMRNFSRLLVRECLVWDLYSVHVWRCGVWAWTSACIWTEFCLSCCTAQTLIVLWLCVLLKQFCLCVHADWPSYQFWIEIIRHTHDLIDQVDFILFMLIISSLGVLMILSCIYQLTLKNQSYPESRLSQRHKRLDSLQFFTIKLRQYWNHCSWT